jgi:predicted nucleic acid-binding Zn ribbon protein
MNRINTYVIIALALGSLLLLSIPLGLTTLDPPVISTSGAIARAQYSYIITVSGSNYQVMNGTTKAVLYQSTSSSQTFNHLLGSSGIAADGSTLYVEDGTYTIDAMWQVNKNNIQMYFSPNALLWSINNLGGGFSEGRPVLWIYGNEVLIHGVTIDGNWLNQPPYSGYIPASANWHGGINVAGNDCTIEYSTIYNIRCYGIWTAWDRDVKNLVVMNCEIYNCAANGVSLAVGQHRAVTGYIMNNHIHHCGDCAVDLSGDDGIVTGNNIHDIGPIVPHGYVDSGWGVCVEFGHGTGGGTYEFVAGNTIVNTVVGVAIQGVGTFHDVLVSGNTIDTTSESGIQIGVFGDAENNIIEYNSLANCRERGIYIQSLASNTVAYGNTYSNCGTNFYNGGTGTITTQPSVTSVKVTSSPTGVGFITANGVAGYAGSYSTSPYIFYAAVGNSVTLVANSVSGYTFSNWSDGGAQSHTIAVPSSDQTYTATYS